MTPAQRPSSVRRPASQLWIASFRNRVLAGLILIVPLWVTLLVARLVFRALDSVVQQLMRWLSGVPYIEMPDPAHRFGLALEYIFVILLAVLLLYLIGLVSTTFIVRRLYAVGERLLLKIPLLKTTYVLTKQVLELFMSGSGNTFREVVAVEYPKKDSYALAFVTGYTNHGDDPRPFVNVFVPTTPNPTSGFLLMVPRDAVKHLDIGVEDAVKMLMSGGAIAPRELVMQPAPQATDSAAIALDSPEGSTATDAC